MTSNFTFDQTFPFILHLQNSHFQIPRSILQTLTHHMYTTAAGYFNPENNLPMVDLIVGNRFPGFIFRLSGCGYLKVFKWWIRAIFLKVIVLLSFTEVGNQRF